MWALLSTDLQYPVGENNLVAWWILKPTMKILEDHFNPKDNASAKSLITCLYAGDEIQMGHEILKLRQVPEGFDNGLNNE